MKRVRKKRKEIILGLLHCGIGCTAMTVAVGSEHDGA